jgi:hypothetical protein
MDPALQTIGITKKLDVLGITLGLTATYFVFTLFGAYIIEYFRRRTLIFVGLICIIIAQTAVTITSWRVNVQGDRYLSYLTVVWIYCFQVCSASFIATMHNLYPVELLSLPLRAKGMALYTMFQVCSSQVVFCQRLITKGCCRRCPQLRNLSWYPEGRVQDLGRLYRVQPHTACRGLLYLP